MKSLLVLGLAFVLLGCGAARDLKPLAGGTLPPAPYGATATPTPKELITASTQARPESSSELLTSSQERQGNEFDLPPAK